MSRCLRWCGAILRRRSMGLAHRMQIWVQSPAGGRGHVPASPRPTEGTHMPLLSKPAFGPRIAIVYITIGALLDVWTAVWYFTYARDNAGAIPRSTWFWLAGFFLTGVTLIV